MSEHAHKWIITHTRLRRRIGDRWVVRCQGCPARFMAARGGMHHAVMPFDLIDTMFLFMEPEAS